MLRRPLLLLVLSATLLAAGCVSTPSGRTPSAAAMQAQELSARGEHAQAAQAWLAIANGARGAAKDQAFLRAAQAWLAADEPAQARAALAQSQRRRLATELAFEHDLANAELQLEEGQTAPALLLLAQADGGVPAARRADWYRLRIRAFELSGQRFEQAQAMMRLQQAVPEPNRPREADRLLAALGNEELAAKSAALPEGDPLYPLAARQLLRRGLALPRPIPRGSGLNYPPEVPAAEADGYRAPLQVAVLLPMSGSRAPAAQSLRDGLLAAFYAETRRRPALRFYDSQGTAEGALAALGKAQEDGAQLLIGPLAREEVGAVLEHPGLRVPILALNRSNHPLSPGDGAQFALSPEEEGIAVADRMADRGQLSALVVLQGDDTGRRILAAFRDRYAVRGGRVQREIPASTEAPPAPLPGSAAPATTESADVVFLIARADPARYSLAAMAAQGLAAQTRYGTSLLADGRAGLDGVHYPELPWLLGAYPGLPALPDLERQLPSAQGGGDRLFAFGFDAFNLAMRLDQLTQDGAAELAGATGLLRLGADSLISREPVWAVIRAGAVQRAED